MTNRIHLYRKMTAVLGMLFLVSPLHSFDAQAEETLDRKGIEKIVREYLLDNPEILFEMQETLEQRHKEQLTEVQKKIIADNREEIFKAPYRTQFGNPDGKIVIAEYFDYNCGFCQRAVKDMKTLIEQNEEVLFVLNEYPVLGEASLEATRVSLAFSRLVPEKQGEFHIRLLTMNGVKNGENARDLAIELGASPEALDKEMEKPEIIEAISNTASVANDLGINGTPSYVIGDNVHVGAVGIETLNEEIKKLLN